MAKKNRKQRRAASKARAVSEGRDWRAPGIEERPVLDDVAEAAQMRELSQSILLDSIGRARYEGESWQAIGEAIGISKQAAQGLYERSRGPAPRATLAEPGAAASPTGAVQGPSSVVGF